MAWYDTASCAVCATVIGRRRFWQEKPRLVAPDGTARDTAYVPPERAWDLLASHVLVCAPCYFHRFGDAKAAAAGR